MTCHQYLPVPDRDQSTTYMTTLEERELRGAVPGVALRSIAVGLPVCSWGEDSLPNFLRCRSREREDRDTEVGCLAC